MAIEQINPNDYELVDRVVHIGTDAKHRGFNTDFVTVVAVLDPGHGGRVFYRRTRIERTKSLAQKLFYEAELSLEVARDLNEAVVQEIVVHVDGAVVVVAAEA